MAEASPLEAQGGKPQAAPPPMQGLRTHVDANAFASVAGGAVGQGNPRAAVAAAASAAEALPVAQPLQLPFISYATSKHCFKLQSAPPSQLMQTLTSALKRSGVDAEFSKPFSAECWARVPASASQFLAQAWQLPSAGGSRPCLLELSRVKGDAKAFARVAERLRSRLAALGALDEASGAPAAGRSSAGGKGSSSPPAPAAAASGPSRGAVAASPTGSGSRGEASPSGSAAPASAPPLSAGETLSDPSSLECMRAMLQGDSEDLAEDAAHSVASVASTCPRAVEELGRSAWEGCSEGARGLLAALLQRLSTPTSSIDSRSAAAYALSTMARDRWCAWMLCALHAPLLLLHVAKAEPAGKAACAGLRREALNIVLLCAGALAGEGTAQALAAAAAVPPASGAEQQVPALDECCEAMAWELLDDSDESVATAARKLVVVLGGGGEGGEGGGPGGAEGGPSHGGGRAPAVGGPAEAQRGSSDSSSGSGSGSGGGNGSPLGAAAQVPTAAPAAQPALPAAPLPPPPQGGGQRAHCSAE